MDEQQIKTLMEGIALKNSEAMREMIDVRVGPIEKVVDIQGMELRKVSGSAGYTGYADQLDRIVANNQKNIQGVINGDRLSAKFTVPAAVNKALVTRAAVSGSTMAYRLPDIGQIAYIEPVISTLFRHTPVGPSSNGMIRYYDQLAITRGANSVAEGALKPESAITWIERTCKIEKVADTIPISKESLADIFFVQGEIRRLLETNLALKVDDLLWDGDGVSPNIKGVYTSAPVFVSAPYADTVDFANLYDLIAVVGTDISNNRSGKYRANIAVVNPADTLRLKSLKNTQGNYIGSPFGADGFRIVESSQVTPNTMVVGDFRYGTIYDLEDVNIDVGYIDKQFIENSITILAEQRLALLIRTADEPAFRKVTDIAAALGDLETPAALAA